MNIVIVQLHPRCRGFRCTYLLITDSCRETDFVRKKKKEGWVYLQIKQHRRCTCNETLRRVRATIVAVEEQ